MRAAIEHKYSDFKWIMEGEDKQQGEEGEEKGKEGKEREKGGGEEGRVREEGDDK